MAFPWLKSKNGAGSGVETTKHDQLIDNHCIFAALSSVSSIQVKEKVQDFVVLFLTDNFLGVPQKSSKI